MTCSFGAITPNRAAVSTRDKYLTPVLPRDVLATRHCLNHPTPDKVAPDLCAEILKAMSQL
jgi:hypothetical protein